MNETKIRKRAPRKQAVVDRFPEDGTRRVVVENVLPSVEDGRYAVKRTVGEELEVTADVFADGHGSLRAVLKYRPAGSSTWTETPMEEVENDEWLASFPLEQAGFHEYTVEAWLDTFGTWRDELEKKSAAGLDVGSELLEGARIVREGAERAQGRARTWLAARAAVLTGGELQTACVVAALAEDLEEAMARVPDRSRAAAAGRTLRVWADRERGRVGAWYEMFPRSAGTDPGRGATLAEAAARLPDIAALGFDVVYLPPVHPIGRTHRKGKNNSLVVAPGDPGSPWAIGSADGGHTAVDPALGTLKDFDRFVAAAAQARLEVALDLAYQCSPDHPWVREHPDWFRHRPDGSIKFAENPPKKYQDIYPLDFECVDWRGLWQALLEVVQFWIGHGVHIFRVDNPHTKPFLFWDWMIAEIQREHPDVIFLAEAFTRPRVMERLAKGGFTQSYSYFTWRNTKAELTEYFTELTEEPVREYMRPNLFANTPDILHEYLQVGGRAAFQVRLVLAATLGASYGIYGPAFELCEATPVTPGSEEYLDSEKYEFKVWDHDRPGNIREFVRIVNRARREHPALCFDHRLQFCPVEGDELIGYMKTTPDLESIVLVVVNLDPHRVQHGFVEVPIANLGIPADQPYQVHDLLSDERYLWTGARNYVRLDPAVMPAHVFVVYRKIHTERDFDDYQ
ncbi:MAG: alpha-1,4-glucan--maltose-1-phosphate maltosyltransferase [Candidatus Eisenbacteria bacterium]